MTKKTIIILGAGAWGTALAMVLVGIGHRVIIVGRNHEKIEYHREFLTHEALPDIDLSPDILWSSDVSISLLCADIILLALPTQAVSHYLQTIKSDIPENIPIIQTAKGIEITTGHLIHHVTEKILPSHPIILLSGPSFAIDVAQGKPTAVTVAARDVYYAQMIQNLFTNSILRPYTSDDIAGVALGGAVKNVLAIAAGYVAGYGLGESAKSALITRGFKEILHLCPYFHAHTETLYGLSGLGDLILTTGGLGSRNYRYGFELARQEILKEKTSENHSHITKKPISTVEGYHTISALMKILPHITGDFPILNALSHLTQENVAFSKILYDILHRPFKDE